MPTVFISRQPLINRQSKIIATRLTLHPSMDASGNDVVRTLAGLVEHWPLGEKQVFINYANCLVDESLLDWPIPENTTLEVPPQALTGLGCEEFVAALKATPRSLCLIYDAEAPAVLESGLHFRFIGFDAQHLSPSELRLLAVKTQLHGIGVAFRATDTEAFQTCLSAGINAVGSWFFKRPATALAKTLNPGQAQIVRVINLVRKNAEVREIEAALKQDVALSYKLLRYINSAGFGLSCEIQSFRHAVTILGYDKLNKWLSLLLATASKDPMAPALMHTALTRAHLMETLAHGLIDRQQHDNLFITGAFSLLDALLGVSMEKVLESMSLPEAISDALLGHGGIYAPFLELAIASEGDDGEALAEQAGMLGLSAEQFNRAQMQALAFAETMSW
jgi:c-di-GMP-related signal transduction protein